jgi:hypothetical protein
MGTNEKNATKTAGKTVTYLIGIDTDLNGGQGRNRTTDTRIFSPLSLVLGA